MIVLTTGGWLGGSLVFMHATRVLDRERGPAAVEVLIDRHRALRVGGGQ